jgi:hypothetical protein
MPSHYTKNESFASGISKVWCVCSDFHRRGVFIGSWVSSTDLVKAVTHQVVVGRPSHMAGRPIGMASTAFLHRLGLPLLVYTHAHEAVSRTDLKPGRPVGHPLGPLVSGIGTLPPCVRYTPRMTLIFVEFQISL